MSSTKTYQTKDSGKRVDYASGMRRVSVDGKPRYDLIYWPTFLEYLKTYPDMGVSTLIDAYRQWSIGQNQSSQLLRQLSEDAEVEPLETAERLAELYARGAEKYGDSNWQLANSEEELQRFKASGFRHLMQYLDGQEDEDHYSAVFWNVLAAEYLKDKLQSNIDLKEFVITQKELKQSDEPFWDQMAKDQDKINEEA